MNFPKMRLLRQSFKTEPSPDAGQSVAQELRRTGLLEPVKAGHRVLITAGSRGIACMTDVLKALIEAVRQKGGHPMLFPAMNEQKHAGAKLAMANKANISFPPAWRPITASNVNFSSVGSLPWAPATAINGKPPATRIARATPTKPPN